MDFGGALQYLKDGKRVARTGWNGKGMWLKLQVPDAHSKMQRPYIYMSPADGLLVPWLASQTDMLADDWCVLGEAYRVAGDACDMTGTLGGLPQAPDVQGAPAVEDAEEIADKNEDILPTSMLPKAPTRIEFVGGSYGWCDSSGNIIRGTNLPTV